MKDARKIYITTGKRIKSVCDGCDHATWSRGEKGRRTGAGWCSFVYEPPPIPRAKYFVSPPRLAGGSIRLTFSESDINQIPNTCPCKKEIES